MTSCTWWGQSFTRIGRVTQKNVAVITAVVTVTGSQTPAGAPGPPAIPARGVGAPGASLLGRILRAVELNIKISQPLIVSPRKSKLSE